MENKQKRRTKHDVKFNVTLDAEQKAAAEQIASKPFTFLLGNAGSGKTLLAAQVALKHFFNRTFNKIVVTRPTVSSEENGFLPGDIYQKMEPWMVPIMDNLLKVYPYQAKLEEMRNDKAIELVALTHFRGRTFENSICIVDEFQNLTEKQLEMCISRLGTNSIMIFCGDLNQIDLALRFKTVHNVISAIRESKHVNVIELKNNHRHLALEEIFSLIKKFNDGNQ